jgi:hypothetical protein
MSASHGSCRRARLEARCTLNHGEYTARAIAERREARQLWRAPIGQFKGGE